MHLADDHLSATFAALADPTRRHVLELLKGGPKTAGELAEHFPFSKPTMSAHFAVLREADLVDMQKSGKSVVYRLKLSVLEDALLGFADAVGVVSRNVIVPKSRPTLSAASCTATSSVTSKKSGMNFSPNSCCTRSASSCRRTLPNTRNPRSMSTLVEACPIPVETPVMTTCFMGQPR